MYVITDNMATAMQEGGEDNAYVVPDYIIMQGDGVRENTYEALEDIAYTADGGGVRESGLYAEPDNPGATTSLRVKCELHWNTPVPYLGVGGEPLTQLDKPLVIL